MNKAMTRIAFALIIVGTSYFGLEAQACTCAAERSPYSTFQESRAVFIGKAISSRDVPITETFGDKTYTVYERVFRFSISELLKGTKAENVEINVGRIDSSCYQGFTIGTSYLVYAFGEPGKDLRAYACSRTTSLFNAADELHYIRNLLKGVPEPRLYGSVMRLDQDTAGGTASPRVTPLAGIKVLIEGEAKKFEAVTDENGLFSLSRVPNGKYKARPLLPRNYRSYYETSKEFVLGSDEQQFSFPPIQQGPSAYLDFRASWNNDLAGRIVDSEGNPIIRAKVSVLLAGSSSPLLIQRYEYDLHDEGRFEFGGINPGRYLLSVDIRAPFADKNRLTRFYYPNASALNEAREIRIGEDETLDDREIRLPPGYVVRQIEGVLMWPNGVPVSSGFVFLAALGDAGVKGERFDSSGTDELGRFSLQAFVGAEYWVHSKSGSTGSGEPIKIKVEMINEPLKIVIPFPKAAPDPDAEPAVCR